MQNSAKTLSWMRMELYRALQFRSVVFVFMVTLTLLLLYDINKSRGPIVEGTVRKPILQTQKARDAARLGKYTPTWIEFFDLVDHTTRCNKMIRVGGSNNNPFSDGSKVICMDGGLAPRKDGSCLVLSFGITNDWSFDDAMASRNCTVYAFDPTKKTKNHKRGDRIYFFNLGLGNSSQVINVGEKNLKVAGYRDILQRIKHVDSIIDYLKVDIEGSELEFFEHVLKEDAALLKNIKQIGMEIHSGKKNALRRNQFWLHLNRLQELGFRQVFSEQSSYLYNERRVTRCYEIVWINERFL
uniref:Methyltransferase-like protein 24 n=1 Tax=Hirondellea gigas TaxID=1518452 RepID=A0A6A7GE79_9CRUS